ncbi:hypothetical protein TNCT_389921 [Trichonephila clavata]|uniref:Uncharacterized protein n=1 Tax=Trichonephila clavata TaxID=2740835 RepID=A0A8X6LBF1_TRICU|nr:hypothetical protein TNCT_389921 [Trichonephila clavata]
MKNDSSTNASLCLLRLSYIEAVFSFHLPEHKRPALSEKSSAAGRGGIFIISGADLFLKILKLPELFVILYLNSSKACEGVKMKGDNA